MKSRHNGTLRLMTVPVNINTKVAVLDRKRFAGHGSSARHGTCFGTRVAVEMALAVVAPKMTEPLR